MVKMFYLGGIAAGFVLVLTSAEDTDLVPIAKADIENAQEECFTARGPDLCACRKGCKLAGIDASELASGECSSDFTVMVDAEKAEELTADFNPEKLSQMACDSMKCNVYCMKEVCTEEQMAVLYASCEESVAYGGGCDVVCSSATTHAASTVVVFSAFLQMLARLML